LTGAVRRPSFLSISIGGTLATEKLELLVLKTLALGPLHGYGIGQRIEQVSDGVFKVTLGALYPALQRLEKEGLVEAEWRASENGRRARYYRLTPPGRRRLSVEQKEWERVAAAVSRILKAT
jgi:transcriptional regulator